MPCIGSRRASTANRGVLEDGVRSVAKWIRKLLAKRLERSVFELNFADSTPESFNKLVSEIAPCEVVLLREDSETEIGRDVLLTFFPPEDNREIEGRRAIHSAVHAMTSHFQPGGFTAQPPSSQATACPHRWYCTHAKRVARNPECDAAPWKTLGHPRNQDCWYSNGMLGLVAVFE
jgi:hypothetical protein